MSLLYILRYVYDASKYSPRAICSSAVASLGPPQLHSKAVIEIESRIIFARFIYLIGLNSIQDSIITNASGQMIIAVSGA